jgi:hypothetical protein
VARDLAVFVCAVLVGTAGGALTLQAVTPWLGASVALNASLAVATTLTGAAHTRLVHRKPLLALVPHIATGIPLAYGAMRAVHAWLG